MITRIIGIGVLAVLWGIILGALLTAWRLWRWSCLSRSERVHREARYVSTLVSEDWLSDREKAEAATQQPENVVPIRRSR